MNDDLAQRVEDFMRAVHQADRANAAKVCALQTILTHLVGQMGSPATIAAFRNKVLKSLETAKVGPGENRDINETIIAAEVKTFFKQFFPLGR